MNDEPICPLCLGELEEHIIHEGEQLYSVFYCDACYCDWLPSAWLNG